MIKNRTVQIIFQTIFCTLAIIGIIGSIGFFNQEFNINFYAYYTNLSNYVCIGIMFTALIQTTKKALKKEDGEVTTLPTFSFLAVILILVTFLVYNILLAKDKTPSEYFLSMSNLLLHVILPLMYIVHWVLFYKHGKLHWYHPLLCVIMPLIYVVFIVIRAAILKNVPNAMLYPYFFLNIDRLGIGGFIGWVTALVAIFVLMGYVFFFIDNINYFKAKLDFGKKEVKNSSTETIVTSGKLKD